MKKEMESEIQKRDLKMLRIEKEYTDKYQDLFHKYEKASGDSLMF